MIIYIQITNTSIGESEQVGYGRKKGGEKRKRQLLSTNNSSSKHTRSEVSTSPQPSTSNYSPPVTRAAALRRVEETNDSDVDDGLPVHQGEALSSPAPDIVLPPPSPNDNAAGPVVGQEEGNQEILPPDFDGENLFKIYRFSTGGFAEGVGIGTVFKVVPLSSFLSTLSSTSLEEIENSIRLIFEKIISAFQRSGKSRDLIKFIIDQEYLDIPIVIKGMALESLDINAIMRKISDVLQSKRHIRVDKSFVIEVDIL